MSELSSIVFDTKPLIVKTPCSGAISIAPLTIAQQKKIISTSAKGVHSGVYLANVLNDIIRTNTDADINILDRVPIIVALRFEAFGTVVNDFDFGVIDLEHKGPSYPSTTEVTAGGVNFTVKIPNLANDTAINRFLIDEIEKDKEGDLGSVVGSMYVYEVVRFIDIIDGQDFNSFSIRDRVDFVEQLPAHVVNSVLEVIKSVRVEERVYNTLGDKSFDLDATFFTP
tara:strand:- start:41967 stop:42644 length:678 start_codon:yes stop_codon:yes gene_type:complete